MKRFRIALVAGLATLALGAIGAPVAAASNGTSVANSIPVLKTASVNGKAQNGKAFSGTYGVQRFVAGTNKVYAVGTLKGTLNGRQVTRYDVMMPVNGMPTTGSSTGAARTAQAAGACTVLHLTLGPIDLNLLGLRVQLFGGTNSTMPQPITLLITANPSQGLLGQLLCGLVSSNQLSGILSGLSSNLQQLANALNGLSSLGLGTL